MNSNLKKTLHCGACQTKFNSIEKLNKHIQNCPEAIWLYPIIMSCAFGHDKMGHPLSHFVWCFRKAVKQNLIKQYAYAVADEVNTLERARLHKELCEILEFPYKKFRPFESSLITKILNRKEALDYLCKEIFMYANTLK
jgi:hypothetical protein